MPKGRLEKLRTKVFYDLLAAVLRVLTSKIRQKFKKAKVDGYAGYLEAVEFLSNRLMKEQGFPMDQALTSASVYVPAAILEVEPSDLAEKLVELNLHGLGDLSSRILNEASTYYADEYGHGPMDDVRPTARRTYEALMFDLWPDSPAAIADFWLTDQEHYEALYYPVRASEITVEDLDRVLGDAKAITELVNAMPSNRHKGIVFGESSWRPTQN